MTFTNLKHAQKSRLEYLDQLFFWEGSANRIDLVKVFGISNAQAALDFKAFLNEDKNSSLEYDSKAKLYKANKDYKRLFISNGTKQMVHFLSERKDDLYYELPKLERSQNDQVFASLYQALTKKLSIEIFYQSMNFDRPTLRWILPTRFASDGVRMHVRAWCFNNNAYRDFVPSRIEPNKSFQKTKKSDGIPADDDWDNWLRVTLKPHNRLSEEQKQAVRIEFEFDDNNLTIRIRAALEKYINRRWGLDHEHSRLEIVSIEKDNSHDLKFK